MSMCLNKNTKMFLKYNKVECRYKSLFLTTAGIVVKKINRLSLKAEKNLNIVIYWLSTETNHNCFFSVPILSLQVSLFYPARIASFELSS